MTPPLQLFPKIIRFGTLVSTFYPPDDVCGNWRVYWRMPVKSRWLNRHIANHPPSSATPLAYSHQIQQHCLRFSSVHILCQK